MRIHHRSRQRRLGSLSQCSCKQCGGRAGDARSGAALIIALAILLVLLSLAITFFLIVRFETNIARQAYDRAQAGHLLDAALAQAQYRLNRDLEVHGDALSLDHGWRAWFSGAAFKDKEWAHDPINGGLPGFSIEGVERALRAGTGESVLYAFYPRDRYLEPLFRGPRTEHWLQVPRKQGNWILLYAPASEMRLVNALGEFLDGDGNDFTVLNDALNTAGRNERFTRWTEADIKNGTRLPDGTPNGFTPDFVTPAFFDPDDPGVDNASEDIGLSEDVVNKFADVDSDGDGMKDAVWVPLSRDINHHGDGIDNDLDGNPDPLDGNGNPQFEAAPFVYHGWGLPEVAKSEDPQGLADLRPIPWNLRERLVNGRGDGLDNDGINGPDNEEEGLRGNTPRLFLTVPLPGLVTQVDLNSDGLFDDRDHYQVEDAGGEPLYQAPLYVRLPGVVWVTVITGQDNSGAETYARAAVTMDDVDLLDNDFDLTVNNFRAYAYRGEVKPGYHNLNVDAIFAQDGTSGRQNLQFFCIRWDNEQGRYVQEAVTPDANFIVNPLRISCSGEAVSEISGRYALNITDEASKVNLNTAGGYFTDASIDDIEGSKMQRAINRGFSPFEYETRILPDLGTQRPLEVWGMRTGTEGPGYNNGAIPEEYLPDAWLPGYGFVDDDGDALLLSLSLRDETGGGLRGEGLFPQQLSPLALTHLEASLNNDPTGLSAGLQRVVDYEYASTRTRDFYNRLGHFEGIDEPSELHLYNPLPNPIADDAGATGLYADRLLLRKEEIQKHEDIAANRWDYLRNLVTVNSDRRNTYAAQGYGRDRDFMQVDPNYATAGQLAANLILRGTISNIVDGLQRPENVAAEDWNEAVLEGFAEGLRQFDTAFTGDLMGGLRYMDGNVHVPGMRFPADPVLQTLRLAVDMAAARDRSFGRQKLVTENLLRNPDIYISAYQSAEFDGLQRGDVLYEALNERERVPGKDLFPAGDVQEYFYDTLGIDFSAKRMITPDLWWKGQTGEDRLVQYAAASLDAIRINEVMVRPVRRVEAETLPLSEQGQVSDNSTVQEKINRDPAPYTGMPGFDITCPYYGPEWSSRSAYDTEAVLGDRTAWVYTYNPNNTNTLDDLIEFEFQATDGLPAGRYYLTVNLTDQYGRMTVNAPDVLQYAVKYVPSGGTRINQDIPFSGLRPENSNPVLLADLFLELGLPYVSEAIINLQNNLFQSVDQPAYLSTPDATRAGSGAAPGWAFLPVRGMNETFPLADNEYLVRFLVDCVEDSPSLTDYRTFGAHLEDGWDTFVKNDLLGWLELFFEKRSLPWPPTAPLPASPIAWDDLYANVLLPEVQVTNPADPADPAILPNAVLQLLNLLNTLYGSENRYHEGAYAKGQYYADGLVDPDCPAYDIPPPDDSPVGTYTIIVPERNNPDSADDDEYHNFRLHIALRLSPLPRESYKTALTKWDNEFYSGWNGAFNTFTVSPPAPMTPAEYRLLNDLITTRHLPLPEGYLVPPTLAVNFFDFSQEPSHEYLELANVSDKEVDVSGWQLEVGVPAPMGIERNSFLEDPYKSIWRIPADPNKPVKVAPGGHLLLGFDVIDGSQGAAATSESPLIGLNGMGLARNDNDATLSGITVPPMADALDAYTGDVFEDATGSVFRRNDGNDYIDNDGDSLSSAPFVFADSATAVEKAITDYIAENNLADTPENRQQVRFEVFDTDGVLAEVKVHGGAGGTIPAWSRIVQLENIRLWRESVPGSWRDASPQAPSAQEIYHYQLNPFTRNTRDITMADLDPTLESGREAALGRLARLVLRGGVLPNYPERDGIDNDGDGGYVVEGKAGYVAFYPDLEPGDPIPAENSVYKELLLSYVPGTLDKDMIDNNLNYRMDERGNEVLLWLNGSPHPNLYYYRHGNPLRSEGVDEGRLGSALYFPDADGNYTIVSGFPGFRRPADGAGLPNFYGHGSYEAAPLPLFNIFDPGIAAERYRTRWLDECMYNANDNVAYVYNYPYNPNNPDTTGFLSLKLSSPLAPESGFPWTILAGTTDYALVANPASAPVIADTDSPDWQAFVERRWNPGDNVIITLYVGDPMLKREADQVTYREYDVINRTLDDIAPSPYVIDGYSNYATDPATGFLRWGGPDTQDKYNGGLVCLDPPALNNNYPGKPTFWLPDHMGLDFYRSLERKHPLDHGDRFGTANRWTATDGAYDDWADSLSVFQTGLGIAPYTTTEMPSLPGQVKYVGTYIWATEIRLKRPGANRFDDPTDAASLAAAAHLQRLFDHALWGSPLRMNSQERLWENPADLGQLALGGQEWLDPKSGAALHNLNLRYGRQFPGLDTYRNTGHHLLQMEAELAAAYPVPNDNIQRALRTERRPATDWALRRAMLLKTPFHTPGDILNLPCLSFERVVEGPRKYVPGGNAVFYWPQYAVSPLNTRYFINENDNAFLENNVRTISNESISKYAYGYDRDLSGALVSQSVWGGGASVLRGYAGLEPDPVVEEVLETTAMNPVVLTVGQARVVPIWPAPPDARVPGTTTFLSDDEHRALFRWPNPTTPPHHWTPVYLFDLTMPGGSAEQPWLQVRYPRRLSTPPVEYSLSRTDGEALVEAIYLFNGAFITNQLYPDIDMDDLWPRWPVPTVASVTVNEYTSRAPSDRAVLYISGHDPAAGEENRAEALFVWDRDDGLENGTYTAYIGTFLPGMGKALEEAQELLENAYAGAATPLLGPSLGARRVREWDPTRPETQGGYADTRRFDPHLAFEFITDRRRAESMLPENADPKLEAGLVHPRIWGQLGQDTPGSKAYQANKEGYIFCSTDPDLAWRAIPVRVTDNYLALRVRNMGAPNQIACISHVVLAPAPRSRGIVNVNTAETRRVVKGITSSDNWTVELFNALMGLPGVVNALNPQRNRDLPPYKSEPLGLPELVIPKDTPSDPADPDSAPIDPWRQRWMTVEEKAFLGPTVMGPLPPAIRDGIMPALPALVRNSDTEALDSWSGTRHGRAMTRLVSLLAANRVEHPVGRYYLSTAELLKGIPMGGMVMPDQPYKEEYFKDPETIPPSPWPLSNRGIPWRATASGFGPRTINGDLVGELFEARYDDIVQRFSQMSNMITTRSDVFEIIATVQSGSAYPDANGIVDYRGDGFFPQAEQRARVIYDRRARTLRQDESGQ